MSLRSAAASALRWSIFARMFAQTLRWGVTLLVIRLLTPEDYGLMAMAMAIISFAALFNELGVSSVIVRAPTLTRNEIASLQGLIVVLNFVLGSAVFLAAPFASAIYGADITAILRASCLLFVAQSIAVVQDALLVRAMDFRSRALVDTISQLAGAALMLLLALTGYGVWALVIGTILLSAIRALGLLYCVPERYPLRLVPSDLSPHIGYASILVAQRIVSWFPGNVPSVVIGIVRGPAALGLFSVAGNLAFLPVSKLGSVFNAVGFATYARSQNQERGICDALQQSLSFLAFFFIPYALIATALVPDAVAAVLGERWLPINLTLQIILLALPFQALNDQLVAAVNAAGDARTGLNMLVASAVLTTGFVSFGAFWSIEAAATGAAIALPLAHLFALYEAQRSIAFSARLIFVPYLRSFLVALTSFVSIFLGRLFIPYTEPFVSFVALGLFGMFIGLLSVILIDYRRMVIIYRFITST